jgi:superfamily II helicase
MSDVQITKQQIVSPYSLTNYGFISMHLREIHCLVFAKLIHNKIITNLSAIQLVSFLSCFTNVSVSEEIKDICPKCEDYQVQDIILKTTEMFLEYKDKELRCDINSEIDYNIHYDLVNYVKEWCLCENVEECKHVLQKLGLEKGIFLGEFVKALLKINNISNELEKVSELIGNIEFLHKLKDIPNITLKYVVTAQSLYV